MVVKHNLLKNMSDEDKLPQDGTNPDENLELDNELEDPEDVDALKTSLEKQTEIARTAWIRTKKAEAELKALKEKKPDATLNNNLTTEDIETSILKAQKVSDDEITYLKKLAKVNGTSIIDAQNDEIYTGWKAKREAEEKSEKAKLGASRGSGSAKKEKEINSPNLSEADHKELWKSKQG